MAGTFRVSPARLTVIRAVVFWLVLMGASILREPLRRRRLRGTWCLPGRLPHRHWEPTERRRFLTRRLGGFRFKVRVQSTMFRYSTRMVLRRWLCQLERRIRSILERYRPVAPVQLLAALLLSMDQRVVPARLQSMQLEPRSLLAVGRWLSQKVARAIPAQLGRL